jgi:pilus assembly protein Flp/PilA
VDLLAYWQRFVAPFLRARFGRTERGASLVEYALLLALIAIVAIVALIFLGGSVKTQLNNVANHVNTAT